ncbi:hypothetical protein GGQ84_002920 [Desulfitispora alkaliphila]|uniref:hypothetical protein n=1 Tax=Desulfitispora alkaliphila TaxID=622674 RepID=UPI003D239D5C
MLQLFNFFNNNKEQGEGLDASSVQTVKEGAYLAKFINETDIASKKCQYYADHCTDEDIKNYFTKEANKLKKVSSVLNDHRDSFLKEE